MIKLILSILLFLTVQVHAQTTSGGTSQVSPVADLSGGNAQVINNNMQYLQTGVNGLLNVTSNLTASLDTLLAVPNSYVKVSEVEASSISGGEAVANTWTNRVFNTIDTDTSSIASLGSNEITLPAGTYHVNASSPCGAGSPYKTRLQNITTSSTLLIGTSVYAGHATTTGISTIVGQIVLSGSTALAVQYYINGRTDANDLGYPASYGINEVYAVAEFNKTK